MSTCARCGEVPADPRALYCPFDGTPLGAAPRTSGDPLIGTELDERYLVLSRIGTGGMAMVYQAQHLVLGRLCAIKLLRPGLPQGDVAYFKREAAATARVASPHAAAVIDFGRAATLDRHYLAMEFVPGVALDKRLEQLGQPGMPGAMAPERVVHIAAQLALGLAAAHEVGVLHRDIKPSNVLLTRVGPDPDFVKIVDFGIARALRPEGDAALPALTPTGILVGTPEYMAPERWTDEPVDARSDVYALGVTLFELLTGDVPFAGSKATQIQAQHLTREAPAPSQRMQRWAIPRSLDDVVLRCLRKEPADRYASMGELLADLGRVWSDVAPPPGLTPVCSYGQTAAAPAKSDELDLTPYQHREPDALLDAPSIAVELGRLVAVQATRLDSLLAVAWPAGLPADLLGAKARAAATGGRLAGLVAALTGLLEELRRHAEEAARREAVLRVRLVEASSARDDLDTAKEARRQLAEVERSLARWLGRDERERRRLEAAMTDRVAEISGLASELVAAHAPLFEAARSSASQRATLRPLVESAGEIRGAIARCLALLGRAAVD